MKSLGLSIPVQTELYLLDLDKRKLRNFCREHNFANMAKRNKKEHEKIRAHLEQARIDQARNATYSSRTGCDDTATDKRKTDKRVRGSAAVNICESKPIGASTAYFLE